MAHTWQFQQNQCSLGCIGYTSLDYTHPITGNTNGTIAWVFPTSGSYSVVLTVTDTANNATASDTLTVPVGDVPPTLSVSPDCPAAQCVARTVPAGSPTDLSVTVTHAGTADMDNVYVDRGDGTSLDAAFCGIMLPWSANCVSGSAVPGQIDFQTNANPLALTAAPGSTQIGVSDSHTYSQAGIYDVKVTVSDQSGTAVTRTITETVTNPVPTVTNIQPTTAVIAAPTSITVQRLGLHPDVGCAMGRCHHPDDVCQCRPAGGEGPPADMARATVATITVTTVGPGGGTTGPQTFAVVPGSTSVAGWQQVPVQGAQPPGRSAPAMATSPSGLTLLFGGGGPGNQFLSDTWVKASAVSPWEQVAAKAGGPSGRTGASLVWDPFGGQKSATTYNSATYVYTPASDTWTVLSAPISSPVTEAPGAQLRCRRPGFHRLRRLERLRLPVGYLGPAVVSTKAARAKPHNTTGTQRVNMTTDVDEGRRCYEAPRMERLGNLPELTQQNFLSTETDFSFAGVLLQGS